MLNLWCLDFILSKWEVIGEVENGLSVENGLERARKEAGRSVREHL
jgi:hypothetical protein